MPRGRRATPPELQVLKGNPRKKRVERPKADSAPASIAATVKPPAFLRKKREREIFNLIANEFVPRNLVRATDIFVLARFAHNMNRWIVNKEALDAAGSDFYMSKSKHNPDGLVREHPAAGRLDKYELNCLRLEVQIGLTPLARNTLMARFMKDGGRVPWGEGSLPFEDPDQPEGRAANKQEAPASASALGFMAHASTPSDKLN